MECQGSSRGTVNAAATTTLTKQEKATLRAGDLLATMVWKEERVDGMDKEVVVVVVDFASLSCIKSGCED